MKLHTVKQFFLLLKHGNVLKMQKKDFLLLLHGFHIKLTHMMVNPMNSNFYHYFSKPFLLITPKMCATIT